jgi:serine acetyltransferase
MQPTKTVDLAAGTRLPRVCSNVDIGPGTFVKFVIEIRSLTSAGAETVVQRITIDAVNPAAALKQATILLESWQRRGRDVRARVFNGSGQEIYRLEK